MNRLLQFFMRMDRRAGRAVAVSIALFACVAAVFIVGRFVLGVEPGAVRSWFETASSEWYALPVTIVVFTALAFVGAPQFALIAAAVFAFGPVAGFIYSWIATMVSATVNFWFGRFFGADLIRRYGGLTVNRISAFVGRNGFFASFIVRIVPSAPFIVVNMAAGMSHMSYFAFIAGAGLGVIPKTALVAFAGGGIIALISGGSIWAAIALGAAALAWLGLMLVGRRWLRGALDDPEPAASAGASEEADPLAIKDAASHKDSR
ncbi:TVP38/TMEM64 family protein [Marinicauda salina]|uniref:TVP38/TMEM64 family membrane protein n=1 Tax=Marinicauda salina TaxID=2135793 RepID=A0A2U2BSS6_9PROT|nr:TVP38/TMEM64 family protein [Marinicauda salina]PWE17054.1 TVP38/TMEM64 family protein [Marinicauda salina]